MAECPGRCGADREPGMFACRPCWRRLPYAMRTAIWSGWRSNDLDDYLTAVHVAKAWYRTHPTAESMMVFDGDAAQDGEPE